MGLWQILLSIYFAGLGAYLSIVLSRVLKQNGRVFNKIEESIRKMDEGFRKMDERAEQRHQEVVSQFIKMDERAEKRHREVMEIAEKRHQEIMFALDKGFGTLIHTS